MNVEQKIMQRLQELITRGLEIEKAKKSPPPNCIGSDDRVDSRDAHQWHTSAKNILCKALGKDSEHYCLFDECFRREITLSPLRRGIGILMAAKDDLEHGYIQDIRNLVAAELFSDFLEQASELLQAGYKGPAAVVAGSVLEDNLRKLCSLHSVDLANRPKLDYMNSQLAKLGVYNSLTQKRLTAIAAIRNAAAHGRWDEFTSDDVKSMIKEVLSFSETHLGG